MTLLRGGRPTLFYGWWIAVACCAITAVAAGVFFWSFGIFILPLEEEFGWLRGQIAGAFSVSWLVAGLLGPLVGRAVDRYGARPLVLGSSLASGLCLALLATTNALWQYYLFHVVLSLCRSWMFFVPLSALITRWFVRQRSVALAVFTSGFAVGGVLFVPLLTFVANTVGWRGGYLFCGALLYAVVLPLALGVLRSSPEEMGLTPDGDPPVPRPVLSAADPAPSGRAAAPAATHQWTVGEALRTLAFWLLALGFSVTFLTQISFSVHAIPFFVSRGLSAEIGAGIVSASTALVGLLRVPFGYILDRTPSARAIMLLVILCQGAAMAVLLASAEPWALWAFVLLWGFTGGGMPLLEAALIVRSFGDRHYGALLGTLGLVETGGTLLGPVLAGLVFDRTGSYFWALVLFLGASAVALACFLALRPPKAKERLSSARLATP